MLIEAQLGHYAVGAFNVENMEFVQAVIAAAKELNAPVILATSANTIQYATTSLFQSMVDAVSDEMEIPVAIHLDHGERKHIISAIQGKYKSVMYDGSLLPYKENVDHTRAVVDICNPLGISVEAELGAISGKPGTLQQKSFMYTNPDTALDFVEKTNVDSLAVAIGTAHGIYKASPQLDYERLNAISSICSVPLVLHGASGLSDEQTKECIKLGICKVNIATELRVAWTQAIYNTIKENPSRYDPKTAAKVARSVVKEIVKSKIRILGSENKL